MNKEPTGGRTFPSPAYPTLFPATTCMLLESLLGTPDRAWSCPQQRAWSWSPTPGLRSTGNHQPDPPGDTCVSHTSPMGTHPDSLEPKRGGGGVSKAGGSFLAYSQPLVTESQASGSGQGAASRNVPPVPRCQPPLPVSSAPDEEAEAEWAAAVAAAPAPPFWATSPTPHFLPSLAPRGVRRARGLLSGRTDGRKPTARSAAGGGPRALGQRLGNKARGCRHMPACPPDFRVCFGFTHTSRAREGRSGDCPRAQAPP